MPSQGGTHRRPASLSTAFIRPLKPSRNGLKMLEATFGKVLDIHGELAHSPAVLSAYLAIQHVIADLGTFIAAT